eukprot:GFUD01044454.1.p1 GENE.GFUD01044454.1~~GFUD01044454.1.p1  ORF type:complete len:161 (+),score=41.51 GFUD01044454.1:72-554(+)
MEQNMMFLTSGGVGPRLATPLASPVIKFTFDDDWRPLTKSAALEKQKIGETKKSPSKIKKKFLFYHVNQKFFYPIAQMYHLDSWPSYLRLLSPAHLVLLFLSSLSMAVAGCLAYPLGLRTVALVMWLMSFLMVSILAVLGAAIIAKKGGKGGLGRILSRA